MERQTANGHSPFHFMFAIPVYFRCAIYLSLLHFIFAVPFTVPFMFAVLFYVCHSILFSSCQFIFAVPFMYVCHSILCLLLCLNFIFTMPSGTAVNANGHLPFHFMFTVPFMFTFLFYVCRSILYLPFHFTFAANVKWHGENKIKCNGKK